MDGDFADFLGGGAPLFGGQPPPAYTLDFNAFGSNPLAAMAGNMALPSLFGMGGSLSGQFFPTQNYYDQQLAKAFYGGAQKAIEGGAVADRETYIRMLRGMSRMAGQPYGLRQERAARTLASGISSVAPILSQMFPNDWDALHGTRGSAAIMAQFLHKGALQAVDPATGRAGMTGESASAMAQRIHEEYFGQNADISQFKGLSAGRFGMLYDELQMRGLAGGSIGALSEDEQVNRLSDDPKALVGAVKRIRTLPSDRQKTVMEEAGLAGLSAAEQDQKLGSSRDAAKQAIAAIKKNLPDELDTIKRDFDADRYTQRIKGLSGVVAGMRDVFGDLGKPNAPMRELMEGLEKLTQGGLTTQSKGALEQSVRRTQSLAQMTGVGAQNMMMMMAKGGYLADQMGIERQFAVAATQGAVAFGSAFGQAGNGDTPHFQARSKEEMTALDQQLRLNASRSGLANQLATTVRMVETVEQAGGQVGPRAAALAAAVRSGKTTFDDPTMGEKGVSVFQKEADWRSLMGESGFRQDQIGQFARQREANRAVTSRLGIGDLVRDNAQAQETTAYYAQSQQSSIRDLLDARGIKGPAREAAVTSASRAAAEAIRAGQYTEDYIDAAGKQASRVVTFNRRDDAARNKGVGEAIRRALAASGVKDVNAVDASLLAEGGFAAFDQATRLNPDTRGYGTGLARLEANDPAVLARKKRIDEEARITGLMRSSLAGLGQAGPLARISDLLQSPAKDLGTALAGVFGGVDPADLKNRLLGAGSLTDAELQAKGIDAKDRIKLMSAQLVTSTRAFEAAKSETDPEKRAEMLKVAQADVEGLTSGGDKAEERIKAILEARNLKRDKLDEVLKSRGAVGGFSAEDVDRLRALDVARSKGILKSATDADMAAGATTGLEQTDAALGAYDRTRDEYAKGGKGDKTKLLREATTMMERGEEVAEGLLADPASLKALGKGGVDLAKGLRDKQLALAALAEKKGKTPAQLIAEGDHDAAALVKGTHKDLKEIRDRQAAKPGEIEGMDADEVKRGDALRNDLVEDDATQNRKLIDRLTKQTGGDKLTDDQRKEIAAKLGTGREGDINRFQLTRQLEARDDIDALAGRKGWDAQALRESLAAGKDDFTKQLKDEGDRKWLVGLGQRAGSVLRAGDEGKDVRAYNDSLRDLDARPAPPPAGDPAGSAAGSHGKVSGTLTIVGLAKAVVDLVLGDSGGTGSTPVSTGTPP